MSGPSRVMVWMRPEQGPLVSAVGRLSEASIVGVACTDPASAHALGEQLGERSANRSAEPALPLIDDLRQALQAEPPDLLWIAAPDPPGPDALRPIGDRAIPVLASEPRALRPVDGSGDDLLLRRARFTPLLRHASGAQTAAQALEDFGEITAMSCSFQAPATAGSLLARLMDAMDLVTSILGPVELIHGTLMPPNAAPAEPSAPAGTFLTTTLRCAGGRGAAVTIGRHGGGWSRRAEVLGPAGGLWFDDTECGWIGGGHEEAIGDGAAGRPPEPGTLWSVRPVEIDLPALIARRIDRLLAGLDRNEPPPDNPTLLALCETALLSGRTGQAESPSIMLELLARV